MMRFALYILLLLLPACGGDSTSEKVETPHLPSPKIEAVVPSRGSGGELFSIRGVDFGETRGSLSLGGQSVEVVTWTDSAVDFRLSETWYPGVHQVQIMVGDATSNSKQLTVIPKIERMEPLRAIAGAPITIAGSNFGSSRGQVQFEGTGFKLTNNIWTEKSITAFVPEDVPGGVHELVVINGGERSEPGNLTVDVVVAGVIPLSGTGGDAVEIMGLGFGTKAGTVEIGGVNAEIVNWSPKLIKLKLPATAAPGQQTVKVNVGGETGTSPFTVFPSLKSVSVLPTATQTHLVLNGSNFGAVQDTSIAQLDFSDAEVLAWNNEAITLRTPGTVNPGAHFLSVTAGGLPTEVLEFELTPIVRKVSPERLSGGTMVIVDGDFFGTTAGTLRIGGTTLALAQWSSVQIKSTALSSSFAPGEHQLSVSAGGYSVENPVVVAPAISTISHSKRRGGEQFTVSGTNFGVSGSAYIGGVVASATAWNHTSTSIIVPPTANSGSQNVFIRSGAVDSVSKPLTIVPYISSISPSKAPHGTELAISGTGLKSSEGGETVTFDGHAIAPQVRSALDVRVPVPDLKAGTYTIELEAGGEISNHVSFQLAPAIDSLSKSAGDIGDALTLFGSGFGDDKADSTVIYGGVPAPVLSWTSSQIRITVPSVDGGGTLPLYINVNGVASEPIEFSVRPLLTSVSLSSTSVGRAVRLTGRHFSDYADGDVFFDGTEAQVMAWNDTEITVLVPEVPVGLSNIAVSRRGLMSSTLPVTVVPGIDSVVPERAPAGSAIVVHGSNFGETGLLLLNESELPASSWSNSAFEFSIPISAPPGVYPIRLISGGFSSAPMPFTVTSTLVDIYPTTGSFPLTVTATGQTFGEQQGGSSLLVGGIPAQIISWSAGQVVFELPSEVSAGVNEVTIRVNGADAVPLNFMVVPKIISLSSDTGHSGESIVVTGNHFGTQGKLQLDGSNVDPSLWENESVAFNIPASLVAAERLLSIDSDGVTSNAVKFTIPPWIASLSASHGVSGNNLKISGNHFGVLPGEVYFNDVSVSVSSWLPEEVSLSVPSLAGNKTVRIKVNNIIGNAADFEIAPKLFSVSPTQGTAGTSLVLQGTSFGPNPSDSKILIGGIEVTSNSWSDVEIRTQLPPNVPPGNQDLTLTVGGVTSAPESFRVLPAVNSLSPTQARLQSSVDIAGTNLGEGSTGRKLWVANTQVTPSVWTSELVTFLVPSDLLPGPTEVWIETGGIETEKQIFQVVRPWISRRSPAAGTSGTVVTLTGSDFGESEGSIQFGTFSVEADVWTNTSVQFTVPGGALAGDTHISIIDSLENEGNRVPFVVEGPDQWLDFDGPPSARSGAAAVWTGTEMIVLGGVNDVSIERGVHTNGARYNPATDSWIPIRHFQFYSECGGCQPYAAWTGRHLFVESAGIYDPLTDSWSTVSATNRKYGPAVWTGKEFVVTYSNGTNMQAARYNPETNLWNSVGQASAPLARSIRTYSVVWSGKEALLWGGSGSDTVTGWRYNPELNSWSPMSTVGQPPSVQGHAAIWSGTEMILWGGYRYVSGSTQYSDSGARYNPTIDKWTPVPSSTVLGKRSSFAYANCNGALAVWGGSGQLKSGAIYSPSNNTWGSITQVGAPPGTRSAAMVCTDSELIVWGGATHRGGVRTGGRYALATKTWTAMSGSQPILAKQGANLLWTGTEILFWGGAGGDNLSRAQGYRYNPATDTWTNISTAGAPTGAYQGTVFTGSKMLAWNGSTGASYDPSTDSWQAIATSNQPSVRSGFSSLWTGDRMIIWGGSSGGVKVNTGAVYLPSTDTWTPTSTAGAPTAREKHSAVWVSGRMAIWGGAVIGGGLYDPISNSWSAISTTGAPSVRTMHAAVSSGNDMYIWGGDAINSSGWWGLTNSGGIYHPATNTWTLLPASPLSARIYPQIAWVDGNLLISGGSRYNAYYGDFDDGAKYDPVTNQWQQIRTSFEHSCCAPWVSAGGKLYTPANGVMLVYVP